MLNKLLEFVTIFRLKWHFVLIHSCFDLSHVVSSSCLSTTCFFFDYGVLDVQHCANYLIHINSTLYNRTVTGIMMKTLYASDQGICAGFEPQEFRNPEAQHHEFQNRMWSRPGFRVWEVNARSEKFLLSWSFYRHLKAQPRFEPNSYAVEHVITPIYWKWQTDTFSVSSKNYFNIGAWRPFRPDDVFCSWVYIADVALQAWSGDFYCRSSFCQYSYYLLLTLLEPSEQTFFLGHTNLPSCSARTLYSAHITISSTHRSNICILSAYVLHMHEVCDWQEKQPKSSYSN